jgi:hypothetical protein
MVSIDCISLYDCLTPGARPAQPMEQTACPLKKSRNTVVFQHFFVTHHSNGKKMREIVKKSE